MSYSLTQEIRLLDAIRGPCITEKAERTKARFNYFVVEVAPSVHKHTIKQAIQWLFKVEVTKIGIINVKGKVKYFKQREGKQKDWKKAYVRLKDGQAIEWEQLNKSSS